MYIFIILDKIIKFAAQKQNMRENNYDVRI